MKKTVFVVMLTVVGNAFAFQPQYEIEYTNHAWGYVNTGCMIDADGNVYKYSYGQASDGKGIVPAGKVSSADMVFATDLAMKAARGKYTQRVSSADAGDQIITARTEYGGLVKLQSTGDHEGTNSAPEAATLIQLIKGYCVIE